MWENANKAKPRNHMRLWLVHIHRTPRAKGPQRTCRKDHHIGAYEESQAANIFCFNDGKVALRPPWALKRRPRYLKVSTFSTGSPLQCHGLCCALSVEFSNVFVFGTLDDHANGVTEICSCINEPLRPCAVPASNTKSLAYPRGGALSSPHT